MAEIPSLYDSVEDLRLLVAELRDLIRGNQATRTSGLIQEMDDMRADNQAQRRELHDLRMEVQRLSRRRPIIWLWLSAFVCFSMAISLMIVAAVNAVTPANWLDIPPGVSFGLGIFSLIVSAPMFLAGFGWLDGSK